MAGPTDEVLGRSILDVLAPDDEFGANHQDLMTVADGKVMSGDRLVTRRDGQLLRVLTFTRPIRDESGKTVALVGVSEDVGARRDAEQQAREFCPNTSTRRWRRAGSEPGDGT